MFTDHHGNELTPGTPVATYSDTGGAEDGMSGGVILADGKTVLWTGDTVEFPTQTMEIVQGHREHLDMGVIGCEDLVTTTAEYLVAHGSQTNTN
jgi:hypothetical protein